MDCVYLKDEMIFEFKDMALYTYQKDKLTYIKQWDNWRFTYLFPNSWIRFCWDEFIHLDVRTGLYIFELGCDIGINGFPLCNDVTFCLWLFLKHWEIESRSISSCNVLLNQTKFNSQSLIPIFWIGLCEFSLVFHLFEAIFNLFDQEDNWIYHYQICPFDF